MAAGDHSLYAIPRVHAKVLDSDDSPLQAPASRCFHDTPQPFSLGEDREVGIDCRAQARTPSPTPSEAGALSHSMASMNFRKSIDAEYFKDLANILSLLVTLVIVGGVVTLVALQGQVFHALGPTSKWLRETPGAWLIPIAIMIILSFPPLFGHELVALYCGNVWGLGVGFGIVAAATITGELATYFTFRYCCRGRIEKAKRLHLTYALLSEVIREGGLKMVVMVRYTAYPPHIATAIFATAGMSVWTFLIAAVLALPKQLAGVYLGLAETSGDPADEDGESDQAQTKTTIIVKVVVTLVTVLVTIAAVRYVGVKMDAIKNRVIYARRKARQARASGDRVVL